MKMTKLMSTVAVIALMGGSSLYAETYPPLYILADETKSDIGGVHTWQDNAWLGEGAFESDDTSGDASGKNDHGGNTAIGSNAGQNSTEGERNTWVGFGAGILSTSGSYNTCIGYAAGARNETGEYNVFLGNGAGAQELGSHKLYITSNPDIDPLIYGEFDTAIVKINGELSTTKAITTALTESSLKNTQALLTLARDNTDPSAASDVSFVLENIQDAFKWTFRTLESKQGFSISKVGSGEKEMTLTGNDHPDGIQILMGDGGKYSNGQWMVASSRAYKENIKEMDADTALEAFHQLKPVSFNYKTNKDEPIVGFIAEDVPDIVTSKEKDSLSAMEIVALLTKVVQVQEKASNQKDIQVKTLEEKVARMELLLTNLALTTGNNKNERLSLQKK